MYESISNLIDICIKEKSLIPLLQEPTKSIFINDQIKLVIINRSKIRLTFYDRLALQSVASHVIKYSPSLNEFFVIQNDNWYTKSKSLFTDLEKIGLSFRVKITEPVDTIIVPSDEQTEMILRLHGVY